MSEEEKHMHRCSLSVHRHETEQSVIKQYTESMIDLLCIQKKRYPLMNEEDVVKCVFQGMLGVGHLISSQEEALRRLHEEMESLKPQEDEPLTEWISPEWFRLNLRAAKRKGISENDIVFFLCQSAKRGPLPFTRQHVYSLCVKLDSSEKMKTAAAKVLDEDWLPGHSDQYRAAYQPAYRLLHKDFINLRRNEK